MGRGRPTAVLAMLAVAAVALGGCAAGSPTTIAPSAPSDGAVAAVQATVAPASTLAPTRPPTATPSPSPTPTATPGPAATATAPASPSTAATATGVGGAPAFAAQAPTAGRPPPPPDPGQLLTFDRGTSGRLEVALTFDAGADTGYADDILDVLRDRGIKATFGMTGVWAENNPELVKRMAADGHQIMNHTYDHKSMTGVSTGLDPMTAEQVADEIGRTDQIVRDLTGYEMRPYFRPPYGDIGPMTSGFVYDTGYYVNVMWTCDSNGWNGFTAQQVVDRCTANAAPGEIILLHVGAAAAGDFEALPGLIDYFQGQGYTFVTIEQMLQP